MTVLALLVRIAVVTVAVLVAGVVAWLFVRNDPRLYEHRTTLILRPNPHLDQGTYENALSTIQQEDLGVELTITSVLASRPFLREVLAGAGAPEDTHLYSSRAILRPGANIVDFRLRGPDRSVLAASDRSLVAAAHQRAADTFDGVYVLERLATVAPSAPVEPRIHRDVQLVAVLTLVGAVAAVFLQLRLQARLERRPPGLLSAGEDAAA